MKRWLALVPLAGLVALAAVFALWALQRDTAEHRPDALIGRPIPETVLPLLSGEGELDLKTAAVGRPVVVNVFASWCAPCRIEHPQLMALQARGVRVVGVAYKDEPENTRAFLEELGDPFALVLVDREGRAGLDLGISGVPESFAVDAQGIVVGKISGPINDETDLERLIAPLETSRRP